MSFATFADLRPEVITRLAEQEYTETALASPHDLAGMCQYCGWLGMCAIIRLPKRRVRLICEHCRAEQRETTPEAVRGTGGGCRAFLWRLRENSGQRPQSSQRPDSEDPSGALGICGQHALSRRNVLKLPKVETDRNAAPTRNTEDWRPKGRNSQ